MSTLNELIEQIDNPELRKRISDELNKLNKQKKFGLVFEEHLPECTVLYDIPVKKNGKVVRFNEKHKPDMKEVFIVIRVDGDNAVCVKNGSRDALIFPLSELVSIAEFGDPIYPYLKPIDTVCNAPDSDLWHILIEADNYHALQLLEYLYGGKVDCIYIDPPYNKDDSRDWKYNCNYVDGNDAYRHSKWLSMIQKRLIIAKKLLNTSNSVLIVTIDETEYLHLGCLLEEMFPEANIQMISSIINPGGTGRANEFTRVNEYIFFVMFGSYSITSFDIDNFDNKTKAWDVFRRHNSANVRAKTSTQFYPLYINPLTLHIEKIGDPIPKDMDIKDVPDIEGCVTTFPVRDDGTEMMWGLTPEEARRRNERGFIKVNSYTPNRPQKFALQHLMSGAIKDIESGLAKIVGIDKDGSVIIDYPDGKPIYMKNQWSYESHNARSGGTELLKKIIGNRHFPYPKSLYAVADCLKLFVANKPNALIVDFFAGSGTTLHAVNMINAVDGGTRRCVLVTNNEMKKDEEDLNDAKGLIRGSDEWNALGIARNVTWPRIKCSILGVDINGKPLPGYYGADREDFVLDETTGYYKKVKKQVYPELSGMKCADGFKSNAVFFKLGFLDKTKVSLGMQLKELLPTLWMKAGAHGACPSLEDRLIPDMLIFPKNKFAILNNENMFANFKNEISNNHEIETVFLVTDYENSFSSMTNDLPGKKTYQLYRDYLDNFRINAGRNSR